MPKKFDVSRFNDPVIAEEFKTKIGGAFEPLLQLQDTDTDVESLWSTFRDTTNKITEEVVGFTRTKQINNLPEDVRKMCAERRKARCVFMNNPTPNNKNNYRKLNKKVKYEVKKWKKILLDKEVEEMEIAHAKNDSHELFKKVKKLAGERSKTQVAAKDKDGTLKTAPNEVMKCWEEYFCKHLNTEFPRDESALQSIPDPPTTCTDSEPFTIEEVEKAVKALKNNKACGWDKIAAETIKNGGNAMNQMLLKISNLAWLKGKNPEDWSKGLITPVFKKGDKLDPANYRAITLLSIPGKVLCRMILNRIQGTVDAHLMEEQCGFRSSRGTTDAVFVVRQNMEKARERNLQLHCNFVNFKAAFDTIWREALWKCMNAIGVDRAMVGLIKSMYNQTECSVTVNGNMTNWFKVHTGVRQGCLLSPCLFNLFLEFVMKDIRNLDGGIQMGDVHINNIRYADDTTLMDLVFEKLQHTTTQLEMSCSRWGMKINPTKCKVMSSDTRDITINNTVAEKVDEFVFLGSSVPSVEADVKRRTRLASWAFGRLKNTIWSNQGISRSLKIRIYKALILPIATYGSETWTLRQADKYRLETFEMRCLRIILGVRLMDKVRNEEIRRRLNITTTICEEITRRRLKWFGHVVRMTPNRLPFQAYKNDFKKRRPQGRPPTRWRDQVEKDIGIPLKEAEQQAQGRTEWRRTTRRRAKGHTVLCI